MRLRLTLAVYLLLTAALGRAVVRGNLVQAEILTRYFLALPGGVLASQPNQRFQVSGSVGGAVLTAPVAQRVSVRPQTYFQQTAAALIRAADEALYDAKRTKGAPVLVTRSVDWPSINGAAYAVSTTPAELRSG